MQQQTPYFLNKLLTEYQRRSGINPSYSLRAFAKHLGLHPSSLSNVLKGKRKLPKRTAQKIAEKLDLSPKDRALFVASNDPDQSLNSNEATTFQLSEDLHYKIISEWEYYAVLSLMETKGFKSDVNWIAKRLGLNSLRAQAILTHLEQADLITSKNGQLSPRHKDLSTSEDIPSNALRQARRQDLRLAEAKLDDINVFLRDFSSSTMTVTEDDLPELKQMIREFRKRFMRRAESHSGEHVYKLAIQFFPLSEIKEQK